MSPSVDLILESFKELTKRKIKRYANVWSTKISELYAVKERINHNYVPLISKCFLVNNLLHDQKVQGIMRHVLPQIIGRKGLSVEDYSLISYVYSCIDENETSDAIISNNYSEDVIKSASDQDLLTFLRTVALVMSRKLLGKVDSGSNVVPEISNQILDFLWTKVKSVNTRYMSESVEYMQFSELLLETIFIADLLQRLEREALNHEIIDYGSIFSLIKVSHLLPRENKRRVVERIDTSDYNTVLDILRRIHYFKLPETRFINHLFNRLCNTPGEKSEQLTSAVAKSKMCRSESMSYLNATLDRIDGSMNLSLEDREHLKRLQVHLKAIKGSRVLENPHRSRIRWNYPCFIA
ncbi:conserved hypothetical protein [Theileria orientalis strain Shintoku]|uniref:Uncharacterized protein n=1 Tax=Theileria orientalis strain Shintoku TaxID=869250 RepID=J4CCR5_THEOR|nr:conserved hypothetical protein [Theileria orientalis strain Shintoku]PVC50207.1 hypothetical protein MACL_00002471 [Theileria orientalis]BAM39852.1 conserved hypothetical protein [Theileria orientalis strain Shintoku]|eukprot:XP_009690153.1 conserved hypothetical protein [Theileria orientalis strain Shintoku]